MPSAVSLAPFAADLAVVNGIMMRRDAGHLALNNYILSGRGDGQAAPRCHDQGGASRTGW